VVAEVDLHEVDGVPDQENAEHAGGLGPAR
jgi:hypothetical protein